MLPVDINIFIQLLSGSIVMSITNDGSCSSHWTLALAHVPLACHISWCNKLISLYPISHRVRYTHTLVHARQMASGTKKSGMVLFFLHEDQWELSPSRMQQFFLNCHQLAATSVRWPLVRGGYFLVTSRMMASFEQLAVWRSRDHCEFLCVRLSTVHMVHVKYHYVPTLIA